MHGYAKGKLTAQQLAVIVSSNAAESSLTAAARTGTAVANAAGTNTKGAYTTLLTPASNVYGLWVMAGGIGGNGVATGILCDIAYGGSDTVVIPNINIGNAGLVNFAKCFYFPGLNIPSTNAIKARTQTVVNNDSATIAIIAETRNRFPNVTENGWVAYGANLTTSQGVAVTPGSGAFGTWTEIGTTSANHNLWSVGIAGNANTGFANPGMGLLEFGVGPDASTVTSIGFSSYQTTASEEVVSTCECFGYASTAGDKVWARIAFGNTVAMDIVIHGC